MKRDIKFRLWDPGRKVMTAGCELNGLLETTDKDFVKYFKDAGMIWMQFTGLQDRNGGSIYEDDIVRILYTDWMSKDDRDPRSLEEYLISLSHIGQVIWDNDAAAYRLFIKGSSWSIHPGTHGRIEIIGDIYQHPELLKA